MKPTVHRLFCIMYLTTLPMWALFGQGRTALPVVLRYSWIPGQQLAYSVVTDLNVREAASAANDILSAHVVASLLMKIIRIDRAGHAVVGISYENIALHGSWMGWGPFDIRISSQEIDVSFMGIPIPPLGRIKDIASLFQALVRKGLRVLVDSSGTVRDVLESGIPSMLGPFRVPDAPVQKGDTVLTSRSLTGNIEGYTPRIEEDLMETSFVVPYVLTEIQESWSARLARFDARSVSAFKAIQFEGYGRTRATITMNSVLFFDITRGRVQDERMTGVIDIIPWKKSRRPLRIDYSYHLQSKK